MNEAIKKDITAEFANIDSIYNECSYIKTDSSVMDVTTFFNLENKPKTLRRAVRPMYSPRPGPGPGPGIL